MKGIWRKCLGLSAGFLLGSAQAAEPVGPDDSSPPIIASSIPSVPAVSLGRPRPVATPAGTVRQASFREEVPDAGITIARSAAVDHQPMPAGPAPVSAPEIVTLPPPTPVSPSSPPGAGGAVVVMPPGVSAEFAASWSGYGMPMAGCHGCAGPVGVDQGDPAEGDNNLLFFQSEYLLWWLRGTHLPPLVTSGNLAPAAPVGAMTGGTPLLFGGSEFDAGTQSGYRLRGGVWLNRDHSVGVEGSYFFLGKHEGDFLAASPGTMVLAVPFVNPTTHAEDRLLLAMPGVSQGAVTSTLQTRLWGTELNLRTSLLGGLGGHLDLLAGFRGLGLDDNLQFNAGTLPFDPTVAGMVLQDRFSTRNRFWGGQVGANGEWRWGRITLDATAKVALGDTRERVVIGGNTLTGMMTSTGGFFAQPTNLGAFRRDRFAVVPELGLNVGFQLTEGLRAYAGYNFLYWSNVARPGEQIDRVVNQPQVPGVPAVPARPAFVFRGSDFWAHGANVGLEFRY